MHLKIFCCFSQIPKLADKKNVNYIGEKQQPMCWIFCMEYGLVWRVREPRAHGFENHIEII